MIVLRVKYLSYPFALFIDFFNSALPICLSSFLTHI